jgi:hypothetical protein
MRFLSLVLLVMMVACAVEAEEDGIHDEPEDFVVDTDDGKADGTPATFNKNLVMSDAMLVTEDAMSVEDVQAFLDLTPYGRKSWLATYSEHGMTAAQLVVTAATDHGINPLVLLARMQGETSLVSKTTRPTQRLIDRALGCGCPDGAACNPDYSGLQRQLDCGARTLRRWYDASVDRSGQWRRGVARKTLDNITVVPANDATASIYQYTPWVHVNVGGSWLAWNVTRKYSRYATSHGLMPVID